MEQGSKDNTDDVIQHNTEKKKMQCIFDNFFGFFED